MGVDGQISSSGQSSNGNTSTATSSGNGANNSSRTGVTSESKNHLLESLIQNIKDLLAETDKEVIVSRIGTAGQLNSEIINNQKNNTNGIATNNQEQAAAKSVTEERNLERSEYQTLFAAKVIANMETGVISVRATSKQHEKVLEFLDKVMGSAKKQVLIEATIVEVVLNDTYQAGIDWSRLNVTGHKGVVFGQQLGPNSANFSTATGAFTQGAPTVFNTASSSAFFAGYLNPTSALGNIAASITLLQQFGDAKVLSSPKLMVLNNQTAVLKVVDNLVYFTIQSQISQSASGVSGTNLQSFTTTPNIVPVGIVMSVTPQINETDAVNINVRPTITRVIDSIQDPNPNLVTSSGQTIRSQIPVIRVREMESMLKINSGNTAVLGGLMQDDIIRNTDKVPGLSEVPGIGKVFTGKNNGNKKSELVIFLRPTVIPSASLESDELQSYKQYLPEQQLQNVLEEAN